MNKLGNYFFIILFTAMSCKLAIDSTLKNKNTSKTGNLEVKNEVFIDSPQNSKESQINNSEKKSIILISQEEQIKQEQQKEDIQKLENYIALNTKTVKGNIHFIESYLTKIYNIFSHSGRIRGYLYKDVYSENSKNNIEMSITYIKDIEKNRTYILDIFNKLLNNFKINHASVSDNLENAIQNLNKNLLNCIKLIKATEINFDSKIKENYSNLKSSIFRFINSWYDAQTQAVITYIDLFKIIFSSTSFAKDFKEVFDAFIKNTKDYVNKTSAISSINTISKAIKSIVKFIISNYNDKNSINEEFAKYSDIFLKKTMEIISNGIYSIKI